MHIMLQVPQELSTGSEGRFGQNDLQTFLPTSSPFWPLLGQQMPHFFCDKESSHGSVQHPLCIGHSDCRIEEEKPDFCILFPCCPDKPCLGTLDAEEAVWAPLSCLFCDKFPCLLPHLEITFFLPSWHTSPFSRDAFSLEESLTSATTGAYSLESTPAVGKTYGNNFFRLC